jgi:transposase
MLPSDVKIFVARQPADLRKSIDGLALLAREVIKQDPLSGHLFVFFNKVGHRVKRTRSGRPRISSSMLSGTG